VFARFKYAIESRQIWWSIKHRHGPKFHRPRNDGFCVFALVKDGASYIDRFVEHYLALGADNIALLDNGSTDGTIDLATRHPQVSVYQSGLPFLPYEAHMRRVFLQRYRAQHWVVAVDVDEFLTFPGEGERSMAELVQHLSRAGSNAATACMIDFLPSHASLSGQPLTRGAGDYMTSLAQIQIEPYPTGSWLATGNQPSSTTRSYRGGIRASVTGTQDILLLKHPLLKIDGTLLPFAHPHFSHHARLSDVSLALHHYKFAGDFMRRIREVSQGPDAGSWWGQENAKYLQYFEKGAGSLPVHTLSDAQCTPDVLQAHGLMQGGLFWPRSA
jgi:hypothetical protein